MKSLVVSFPKIRLTTSYTQVFCALHQENARRLPEIFKHYIPMITMDLIRPPLLVTVVVLLLLWSILMSRAPENMDSFQLFQLPSEHGVSAMVVYKRNKCVYRTFLL